jgi:predicted kinase
MISWMLIVAGLPASGKTEFIKQKYGSREKTFIFEDISEEDMSELHRVISSEEGLVIVSSPFAVLRKWRLSFLEWCINNNFNFKVSYVFFENNPKQCLNNAKRRPENKVENLIIELTKDYTIPETGEIGIRQVWCESRG